MAKDKPSARSNPLVTVVRKAPAPRKLAAPALEIRNGNEARNLRLKRNMNQMDFWSRLGVTQSGGSRYESGRNMPHSTVLMLNLVYGGTNTAGKLLEHLRACKS